MSETDQTKVNKPEETAGEFTLEQILSEYKSEAFIRNERKTTKKELEKQAEQIIAEIRRELEDQPSGDQAAEENAPEQKTLESVLADLFRKEPEAESAPEPETIPEAKPEERTATDPKSAAAPALEAADASEEALITKAEPASAASADEPDQEPVIGEEALQPAVSETEAEAEALAEEEAARLAEEERLREEKAREKEELRRLREEERRQQKQNLAAEKAEQRKRREEERAAKEEAKRRARQEWLQKMADMGPTEAAEKYASGVAGLQRRTVAAFILCALMTLATLLGGRETAVFSFLQSKGSTSIVLLAMQILTMACGWDVLVMGIGTLVSAKPGCETMITFANLAALGDALWIIRGSAERVGLPYCAGASLILAFALLGKRMGKTALRDSFRTMRGAKVPTVVQMDPELTDLGSVITKHLGGYRGFIARMLQQDPIQELYRKLSLLLIAVCVVLAVLTSLVSGDGSVFHALAGLGIAAVTCTPLLIYHRPFALIARRLAGRGAAIAGWSGAEEINKGMGLILRDGDLFPDKTVSVTGMKVLSGTRVEQVISYTGSMILASGSGLGRTFGELMRQYAAPTRRTEGFQYDLDGGYSAYIAQDQVFVGTGAFMNLKGIRIPANIDVNGAIYTAVNGKLCALFIVDHTPADGVRTALLSLPGSKLRPIYAIRDFSITPAMLKSKFRLGEGELSFPPAEDRFRLSTDGDPDEMEPPAAIMTREGVGHYLEVIRSGRRMIRAVHRAAVLTFIGSFLAMVIIALAVARGAYVSISAWNLIVYLLGWTAATLLLSDNADGD